MQNILIIFSLILVINSCNTLDKKKEDYQLKKNIYGIFGKPKLIKQRHYSIKDSLGNLVKGKLIPFETYDIIFDSTGNLIKKKIYGVYNRLTNSEMMFYNDSNNLIKTKIYDGNGNLEEVKKYFYDTKNRLIKKVKIEEDNGIMKIYDKDKFIRKSEGEKMYTITNYDYSSNIKIEKSYFTNLIDTGISRNSFKYNLDSIGNTVLKRVYSYDSLEEKIYYKYNKYGNIVEERIISNDKEEKLITYKYKFNKNNNWISKQKFINEIPMFLFERKIEYY